MPRLRDGTKLADDNLVIPETHRTTSDSDGLGSKPRPSKRQKTSEVSDGDMNIKRIKEANDDAEKNIVIKSTGRATRRSEQVSTDTSLQPEKLANTKSKGALSTNNHATVATKGQIEVTVNDDNKVVRETSKKKVRQYLVPSTAIKTEENKESGEILLNAVAKKARAPRRKAADLVSVKTEAQEVVSIVDNIKTETREDFILDIIKTEVPEEVAMVVETIKVDSGGRGKVTTSRKRQNKNKSKQNVKSEALINDSLSTEDAVVTCDKKDVKIKIQSDNFADTRKFVGAHTSIAGSLSNAILETIAMGGKAFGMFLKSSRTWNSKPLSDVEADKFKTKLEESGIESKMVVPHGSYLLNCGASNSEVLTKSRDCLVDELLRCEKLGLPIYNFHPGSSNGVITVSECIARIVETINYAHSKTVSVITVIENMSCQGNTVGGKFSELREMIDGVKDKSRVGVCLDTCHAFAAGYDIHSESGYELMKAEFESVIGRQYLKAVHLNDSKGDLGCHLDRHENIGKGKIGLAAFRRIMNDPFFNDIPMILETPEGDYGKEIRTLYGLCKSE